MEADWRGVLTFIAALICGLLLGLSAHVILMRHGLSLTAPWRDLFPSELDKREAALAWWVTAAAACAGGFCAKRLFEPRQDGTGLRTILVLVLFGLFAFAGHAAMPDTARGFAQTFTGMGVMALATLMALCGLYAAQRR